MQTLSSLVRVREVSDVGEVSNGNYSKVGVVTQRSSQDCCHGDSRHHRLHHCGQDGEGFGHVRLREDRNTELADIVTSITQVGAVERKVTQLVVVQV